MSFCKKINKKRLIPKPNVTFILCGKPHSTGVIHNAERKRQVLFPSSIRGNFPSPTTTCKSGTVIHLAVQGTYLKMKVLSWYVFRRDTPKEVKTTKVKRI